MLLGVADDVERGLLEDPDELPADDLPLLLGVGDPGQRGQELLAGVDDPQVDAGDGDEVPLDLLGLALAHQPVVDVDAGEPVTDRPLHERGGDGGVDPAGQRAQRPAVADLRADPLDLLLDDVGHRPGRLEAGDVEQEVLEHRLPVRGVPHLGVELDAGELAVDVLERGDRRTGRRRRDGEARAAPR